LELGPSSHPDEENPFLERLLGVELLGFGEPNLRSCRHLEGLHQIAVLLGFDELSVRLGHRLEEPHWTAPLGVRLYRLWSRRDL
jgi:hypothetical protein